jgi:4-aminobutyrate aminotransferase-like enzyme
MDEIQCVMGRTGKLFAFEYLDTIPDIILTGKSIAAGLPQAGITGRTEIVNMPMLGAWVRPMVVTPFLAGRVWKC